VLTPASHEAALGHLREHDPCLVTSAAGGAPVHELANALPRVIAEKASKVRSRARYRSCTQWWLVLDDDILIAPSWILSSEERTAISERVAQCPDVALWSKVVLFNRWQPTPPPAPAPGWFWTLWESDPHSPLALEQ